MNFNYNYMEKLQKIIRTIDYTLETGNPDFYECNEEDVKEFLDISVDAYALIQWPGSQEYMEKEWFDDEAILALGSEDKTGGSAYFIPIKYLI